MRVIAIDWSGRAAGAAESIWRADVIDGRLIELTNGLSRKQVIAELIETAHDGPELLVGLDFAFSFPSWWCAKEGWSTSADVWAAIAARGEEILASCPAPFWGRRGKPNPNPLDKRLRWTERETAKGVKSVFQIGGAGAVGTGSIRGMPHLLTLAEAGFGVWPFDQRWPRVVEIYPRLFTGPVRKNRWAERHELLFERFPDQRPELLERAAGSEDAFDAAFSALAMGTGPNGPNQGKTTVTGDLLIEGEIWNPPGAGDI